MYRAIRFPSDPAPLLGAAAVVGNGRHVLDADDLDAGRRERPDGGLATRAGAPHQDVHLAHAVLHGPAGAGLGRQLGGEGGRLAGALEADVAGRSPGEHVAVGIGDGDDGVVERALDVGDAVGDVLALPLAGSAGTRLLGGLGGHLLAYLLLPGDGLLRALAGPGVRVGALAVDREAAAVTHPLVAVDLHLALDVLGDVAAQVTFDAQVGVDVVAQADDLLVGQITHPGVRVDLGLRADLLGLRLTDAEDVGEGDLESFLPGDVHTGNTGHAVLPSPDAACGGGCRR